MGVYGTLGSFIGQMVGIPSLGHFCANEQNPEVESSLASNRETGMGESEKKKTEKRER